MIVKKPFLRVAYLGDSHCNGGFGLGEFNWRNRLTTFLLNYYEIVEAYKFCNGGETIASTMPDGYVIESPFNGYNNGIPIVGRNITAALEVDPDLILILHSGNHFANGFTFEYVKTLYIALIGIIESTGKKFAISSAGPRGTYFPGPAVGVTVESCRAASLAFNEWFKETYPEYYFDIWDSLADPLTQLPDPTILLSDGIHYDAEGHRRMAEDTKDDAYAMDDITGYDKKIAYDLRFVREEGVTKVTFSETNFKHLVISTSNDGIIFTPQITESYSQEIEFSVPIANYVKVVINNSRGNITVTKSFI